MSRVTLELDELLVALLRDESNEPVEQAVLDLIVMELYRRGTISGGKAAELLGMERLTFIQHADQLGIPYFNYTDEDLAAERAASEAV